MTLAVGLTTEYNTQANKVATVSAPIEVKSADIKVFPDEVTKIAEALQMDPKVILEASQDPEIMKKFNLLKSVVIENICKINLSRIVSVLKQLKTIDYKNIQTANDLLKSGHNLEDTLVICQNYDSVQEYERKEFGKLTTRNAKKVA